MFVYSYSFHTAPVTQKHTPVHGGIGGIIKTSKGGIRGTVACAAVEKATRKPVLLSNQHAFFPVVNGVRSPIGTKIYQQGDISGAVIATSYKTIAEQNPWPDSQVSQAIKTVGIYHDSAIALAKVPTTNWVNGIGAVTGIANPTAGQKIKFFGSTSGLQKGTIVDPAKNITAPVGGGKTSVRRGVVMMDITSAGGDSGSLVVTDPGNKAVALLFGSGGGYAAGGNMVRIAQVYGLEIGGQSVPGPGPSPTPTPTPTPDKCPPGQYGSPEYDACFECKPPNVVSADGLSCTCKPPLDCSCPAGTTNHSKDPERVLCYPSLKFGDIAATLAALGIVGVGVIVGGVLLIFWLATN